MGNRILHTLRHYRDNKAELESIRMKLCDEEVIDAVQSAAKFPYSKHTAYVQGIPETPSVIQLRIRQRELRRDMRIAEQFADSLPQYRLQEAVRIYYLYNLPERMKWEDVAFEVGYSAGGEALRKIIFREAKKCP